MRIYTIDTSEVQIFGKFKPVDKNDALALMQHSTHASAEDKYIRAAFYTSTNTTTVRGCRWAGYA